MYLVWDVAHLGGEHTGPVAVAVAKPLLTALMAISTEHGGDLKLDQLLQAVAHQLGSGTMTLGHGSSG